MKKLTIGSFVHVEDMMVQNDCKSIRIRTIDTDVVVIMLAFMPYLMFHDSGVEVLIDFGTGDHRRMISLNRSFDSLGCSFTKALLLFHAFTGCDSTSSFFLSLVRLRRFGSISYSLIHAMRRLLKHLQSLAGPHFDQLPKTTWQRSNYLLAIATGKPISPQ